MTTSEVALPPLPAGRRGLAARSGGTATFRCRRRSRRPKLRPLSRRPALRSRSGRPAPIGTTGTASG
ncbi:hypothetical protein ABZ570_00040 [Micromonospora sp. NPDC007271]|uniref:hypothetical protein n=1 Tax=Micromonospora sp. NPDC007271 TaxID=3154587 RepID=UPI0033E81D13